jgi:hypothetical protein
MSVVEYVLGTAPWCEDRYCTRRNRCALQPESTESFVPQVKIAEMDSGRLKVVCRSYRRKDD